MSKQAPSALAAAAAAFEDELATYARLGDLFLRAPLDTLKHIERANATLSELAASEGRLQQAGQQLVVALTAARERQESLSKRVVEHAPALQDRNRQLAALMGEMSDLAARVATLNAEVGDNAGATVDVATGLEGVSARAKEIAGVARTAGFTELADQAHALHQRLLAIGKKLQRTGDN